MTTKRRTLSLLDMLVWTYRDQKAHRILRDPADWFWYLIANDDEPDIERPAVHRDAALVHANVMELEAFALIDIGADAEVPQRCDEPVRCVALPVDRFAEDYGRAVIDGKLTDYKIAIAERVSIVTPIFERRGRKRVVHVGNHTEAIDVRYCPIAIEPSPEWRDAKNAAHAEWIADMAALASRLRGVQLAGHVIRDLWRWERRGANRETTTLDKGHGFRVHLRSSQPNRHRNGAALGDFRNRNPASDEARERMRQAARGRKPAPESVAKMAASMSATAWRRRL